MTDAASSRTARFFAALVHRIAVDFRRVPTSVRPAADSRDCLPPARRGPNRTRSRGSSALKKLQQDALWLRRFEGEYWAWVASRRSMMLPFDSPAPGSGRPSWRRRPGGRRPPRGFALVGLVADDHRFNGGGPAGPRHGRQGQNLRQQQRGRRRFVHRTTATRRFACCAGFRAWSGSPPTSTPCSGSAAIRARTNCMHHPGGMARRP